MYNKDWHCLDLCHTSYYNGPCTCQIKQNVWLCSQCKHWLVNVILRCLLCPSWRNQFLPFSLWWRHHSKLFYYLRNRTSGPLHDQIKSNSCFSDIVMGWALLTDGLHGVFGITEYLCVTNVVLVGAITWWSSAVHVNIIWHAGYSRHLVGFVVITLRFDLGQASKALTVLYIL